MTDTKSLMEKHGIRANKSLGQNFLHKEDILNDIANAVCGANDVLEIGAGLGVLTKKLCERCKNVTTVEIDRSLKNVTDDVLCGITNHTMVYCDFLKFDLNSLNKHKITVVGNLPYNITGEIVTKLFKNHSLFKRAVIMIQKEAALKLCADAGTKEYRAISALTQYFCNITTLFDVAPDSFIPAPHVTSRVIMLDFKDSLTIPPEKQGDFIAFVHRVFSQRRKLLTSIFQNAKQKQDVKQALEKFGFSPTVRGEALTPDSLADLFCEIYC